MSVLAMPRPVDDALAQLSAAGDALAALDPDSSP